MGFHNTTETLCNTRKITRGKEFYLNIVVYNSALLTDRSDQRIRNRITHDQLSIGATQKRHGT